MSNKDYYTKFNLKNAQNNPSVLLQASPDDFKKYNYKFKQSENTENKLHMIFFSEEHMDILQKQLINISIRIKFVLQLIISEA